MRRPLVMAALVCAMLAALPAPSATRSTKTFASTFNLPTGGRASAIAVGDINGDGRDDAVVATTIGVTADASVDYYLFIFLQQADGTLGAPIKRPYLRTASVATLALGDMNNDGVLDIVVGHKQGLTLFPGGPTSNYNGTPYVSIFAVEDLALVDANDDGNLDAITIKQSGSTNLVIRHGNGALAMTTTEIGPVSNSNLTGIVPGDFNEDGRMDFAIASFSFTGGGFNVYTRRADSGYDGGNFMFPIPGPSSGPRGLFAGDLNRDGRDDLGYVGHDDSEMLWLHPQRPATGLDAAESVATARLAQSGRVVDLDQDGWKDLLVLHDSAGEPASVGVYAGGLAGLAPEVRYPLLHPATHDSHQSMDTGDLDSDGCPDVAVADSNDGLVILPGQDCRQRPGRKSDLVGDGTADILWHNPLSGQNLYWRAARVGGSVALTTVVDTQWKLRLTGDFDGDGRADLLWRHASSGAMAIWRGGNHQDQQPIVSVTSQAWQVVGAGDLDGDGKSDLLWRNAQTGANVIWKNASHQNQQTMTGVTDLGWQVAGLADFNGDGKADVLWRHATQGHNAIWLSGNFFAQQAVAAADPSWRIAGVGDFNGDGRADIVWRNSINGANKIWRSALATDVDDITDVTGLDWQVAAAADYDADGRDDLLWRNNVTGANAMWKAGRYTSQQAIFPRSLPWQVVN